MPLLGAKQTLLREPDVVTAADADVFCALCRISTDALPHLPGAMLKQAIQALPGLLPALLRPLPGALVLVSSRL
jgi:hypothetical protein